MQVDVVGRGFGRFYAALRQTPQLLKIGNVWPRDGLRGPGIPGAESASGTPGKRAIFRQTPCGVDLFSLVLVAGQKLVYPAYAEPETHRLTCSPLSHLQYVT